MRVIIIALLTLVCFSSAWADRASDRVQLQDILGVTELQMDSLDVWYPGTDAVIDFTDRAKFHFNQYREQWEVKNGKDLVSQTAVATAEALVVTTQALVVAESTKVADITTELSVSVATADSLREVVRVLNAAAAVEE